MSCDVTELLASGSYSGLTKRQLEIVTTQLLREIASSSETPSELLNASRCNHCYTNRQLEIMKAQLLCEIAEDL